MNEIMSGERHLCHIQQLEQAPLEIQKLLEQERAARLAAEAEAKRRAWLGHIIGFISGVAATVVAEIVIRALIG